MLRIVTFGGKGRRGAWVGLLICTMAWTVPTPVQAQIGAPVVIANNKARALYEKALEQSKARDFPQALQTLNTLNTKFPSLGEAWLLKGSLLKAQGDTRGALAAYREGLAKVPVTASRASQYLLLGDLGLAYGDYATAAVAYQNLLKVGTKVARVKAAAELGLRTCEFAQAALQHPVGAAPAPLAAPLNSFKFQYFPTLTADNRFLLFTGRPVQSSGEDLFVSRRAADGAFSAPVGISPNINSSYHEGAGTISGDGKTLVFASCDRPKSLGSCDLYISRRTGNAWSAPQNLGAAVNSPDWDSQPSLSADGRTLYFTSTRKGGQGQEDIYVTTLQENGSWAPAQNLGAPVNTLGKDMAPFIHASGTTLYYVTDGLVGMGGLDIFRSEKNAAETWGTPKNLGYPLNTFEDEASLFVSSDNQRGFYSRSQIADEKPLTPGAMPQERGMQLFGFDVPGEVKARETSTYAQGRVFDATTKKPLRADVKIYDVDTDALTQFVISDPETGEYTAVLNEGHRYAMYAAADKYLLKSLSFDYAGKKQFDALTLDLYLDPVRAGGSVVLNNLFFDTNKYELEPRSRTELNRLIEFMRQYKDVQIEVAGHTDNVGTDAANLLLSEHRAQAVVTYLTAHGVKAARLRAKGYGVTHPLGPNDTENNRRLNRRIELRIL